MKYTIDELKEYKVENLEDGRSLADDILKEQHRLNKLMSETKNNNHWQKLNDKHYDLRQIRRRILDESGKLAIKRKQEKNG